MIQGYSPISVIQGYFPHLLTCSMLNKEIVNAVGETFPHAGELGIFPFLAWKQSIQSCCYSAPWLENLEGLSCEEIYGVKIKPLSTFSLIKCLPTSMYMVLSCCIGL